ncbi:MAG TPA: cadherin-like domain-containing protein, partial [Saprospiraceae bacterium]|nr:cadherin-like domain-containing protein [Saprospiraceae bacterium]
NDGSEDIIVPYLDKNYTSCHVKIEAADNIFFDISNQNFSVVAPTIPALYFNATSNTVKACLPATIPVELTLKAFGGYDSTITLKVSGLPPGAFANFSKNPVKPSDLVDLNIDLSNSIANGIYLITITAEAPGLDTFSRVISFETVSTIFDKLNLSTPLQGSSGVNQLPTFTWGTSPTAQTYEFELATSPSFGNTIVYTKTGILTDNLIPTLLLDVNTLYFWRVRPANECKQGDWSDIFAFHTITLSCNTFKNLDGVIGISASGKPTVVSKISILTDGDISDVKIASIKGFHEYFGDLDVALQSPAGTIDTLFINQCNSFSTTFNFGFDDQSPQNFNCPPNNGKIFKPLKPLSQFNGQKSAGEWKLILHDTEVSSGGQLQEWNLSICTSVSQNPPFVIINDTLKLKPLTAKKIDTQHLEIGDANNTADQLVFTLVKQPDFGVLGNSLNLLSVGDKFTQSQINSGIVAYINEQASADDQFSFTVEDGEGGWLGILQFHIIMDDNILISTKEELSANILLYPNPVNDKLQIKILQDKLDIDRIDVYNISGSKIQSWNKDQIYSNQMNVNNIASGVYFVNVFSNQGSTTRKVVIQH